MSEPVTNVTQQPVPGSPEHDASLAAVFDSRQQAPASTPAVAPAAQPNAVPDYVPEKFRTAADPLKAMADAYAALEAKQANPATPKPVETPDMQAPTTDDAKNAVQAAGLDFDALGAKYLANGSLDDADFSALAGAGISRDMVNAYIAGQEAIADQMRTTVFNTVGGEDKFSSMTDWAGKNLPKAEVIAFNEVMENGTEEQVKLAVAGLNARFVAAVGNEPNLLGGNLSKTAGDTFRSVHELTEAMRDPRYAKDPAYRSDVEAKLARSNIM